MLTQKRPIFVKYFFLVHMLSIEKNDCAENGAVSGNHFNCPDQGVQQSPADQGVQLGTFTQVSHLINKDLTLNVDILTWTSKE